MRSKKLPVRIRFANESDYSTIKIHFEAFKPEREFKEEIFGWIDNIYVAMNLEDWKNAIKIWEAEENSSAWDLTIIMEKPDGYLVSSPIGDTQFMTKAEYESAMKKRNQND
jgi:hypothetical protein